MPYRRLPNTDAARIRAMKTALEKGKEMPPHLMAFSSKTLVRLETYLPHFEDSIHLQRQSISSQNNKSKDYNEIERKARIYLTHFIKVMNMAIFRGELPVETRAYYGLPTNECTVPSMNTENELLNWGKRIIEGEESRIKNGGSPITNPTIAVVRIRFEQYCEALNFYKTLNKRTMDHTMKNKEMRREADEIILNIWNEVETSYSNYPPDKRREKCEEYGLVYFFRKYEQCQPLSVELQSSL